MNSMSFVLIRCLFMAAVIVMPARRRDPALFRLDGRTLAAWTLLAGTSAVSTVMFNYSLTRIPIAVTTVLNYTSPVFVALISLFLFGERLGIRHMAALALSVAGVGLVSGILSVAGAGLLDPLPVALAIGSGFLYAGYIVAAGRLFPDRPPLSLQFWAVSLGALFVVPLMYLGNEPLVLPPWGVGWIYLLGACVITGVGGFYLHIAGVRLIRPHRASVLMTAEPVLATLWGYLILGELLTRWQLLGMFLVIGGILCVRASAVTRRERRSDRPIRVPAGPR